MTDRDISVIECSIPEGLTISEYRALRRRPVRRSVVARLLARTRKAYR